MTLSVSISVINDALNMEPWVGFFPAAPARLRLADGGPELDARKERRPGSGMTEPRREPPLPESEKDGEPG